MRWMERRTAVELQKKAKTPSAKFKAGYETLK
jgi:hypothetical protein